MKVLIIEDETLAAERLSRLLQEINPAIELMGIVPSIRAAVAILGNDPQPQLIMADIELADGASLEIFKQVAVKSAVIFTTAYNEYALQAFSTNSIAYLLKPIRKEDLEKALHKLATMQEQFAASYIAEKGENLQQALQNASTPFRKNFLVKMGQRLIPVDVDEIAYFFADGRLVFLTTWDKRKMLIDHSLDELESMLDGENFYRANRAFLVHRKSVQKCKVLLNRKLKLELLPPPDREVLVSKEKLGPFKKWLDA
ncbi:LytR/AlgR family response regulator transcription factor [Paracnuella aquatica]|uniref:LytR/AlgR family response regulator transcription factor n=1 Tax=Paracnuella aquatica TaxID=2268757 RepID=UPI000DEF9B8F|nr:LytTR family DNA-binding domain-containing protein [Paracnuella aquatica]RPD51528.1 DNA-binding response regulator [Paracnuella aquatica]